MNKEQLSHYVRLTIFISVLFFGMNYLNAAWDNPPTGTIPPANNTEVPINVGGVTQKKSGLLDSLALASDIAVAVDQNGFMGVGNAYTSSGGPYSHFANYEYFDGAQWRNPSGTAGALFQIDSQDFNFYTHNGAGGHSRIFRIIGSSGNVGIGVDSPSQKIDALGVIQAKNASGNGIIQLWPNSDTLVRVNSNSGVDLSLSTGGTDRLVAKNNTGNIGIGTSNPGQKLEVVGNIQASGDICTSLNGGKCLSSSGGSGACVMKTGVGETGNNRCTYISFPSAFSSQPVVVTNPEDSTGTVVVTAGISTTGFSACGNNYGSYNFRWVAYSSSCFSN